MKHCYRAGIDIGSTTAKLVILDERGVLCYGDYRRHCAHTQETLAELLEDACAKLGPCDLRLKITGLRRHQPRQSPEHRLCAGGRCRGLQPAGHCPADGRRH